MMVWSVCVSAMLLTLKTLSAWRQIEKKQGKGYPALTKAYPQSQYMIDLFSKAEQSQNPAGLRQTPKWARFDGIGTRVAIQTSKQPGSQCSESMGAMTSDQMALGAGAFKAAPLKAPAEGSVEQRG